MVDEIAPSVMFECYFRQSCFLIRGLGLIRVRYTVTYFLIALPSFFHVNNDFSKGFKQVIDSLIAMNL